MSKKGENITKRKDGRWEARVIKGYDCSGKALYKYIYGRSYSDAKEKKKQFLSSKQNDRKTADNVLYQSILEDFMLYLQNKSKESTYARYEAIICGHIIPKLGNLKLNEITSPRVDSFTKEKLQTGRLNKSGGLSPKRVCDILSVLKLSLNYAEDRGFSPNPIKISFPRVEQNDIEILSVAEESQLTEYILKSGETQKFGIVLALYTGIRIGELCALTWKDVNIESQTLTINKTIQRIADRDRKGKTKIIIDTPKTKASVRCIPFPTALTPYIVSGKECSAGSNSYVLTGSAKYIEPSNYYVKYQKWLRECGITKHSFHSLRHTFATHCIENGFDTKALSEILGHSDVKITLSRYVHPSMAFKRANMEIISGVISSQYNSHLLPQASTIYKK